MLLFHLKDSLLRPHAHPPRFPRGPLRHGPGQRPCTAHGPPADPCQRTVKKWGHAARSFIPHTHTASAPCRHYHSTGDLLNFHSPLSLFNITQSVTMPLKCITASFIRSPPYCKLPPLTRASTRLWFAAITTPFILIGRSYCRESKPAIISAALSERD